MADAALVDREGGRHQPATVETGAASPVRWQYRGHLRVAQALTKANQGVPMAEPQEFPGMGRPHV